MIAPSVFAVLLSIYCVLLYRDGFFTLFDLGVSYRTSLLFARTFSLVPSPASPLYQPLVSANPDAGLFYTVVGLTLFVYNNPVTVLIDQTLVVALGGYAIFRIARVYIGGLLIPLTIQVSYFLYPSTYGYLTHGGNLEVFFEGLFLLGYMFYILNRRVPFVLLTILAATTLLWAPVIIVGFYGFEVLVMSRVRRHGNLRAWILSLARRVRFRAHSILIGRAIAMKTSLLPPYTGAPSRRTQRIRKGGLLDPALLIALCGAGMFFAFSLHSYSWGHLIASSRLVSSASTSASTGGFLASPYLPSNLGFAYSVFAIVLFLPLLSPYVLFPVLYLSGIIFFAPSARQYFAYLQQYPYLFVGFLFLSVIDVYRRKDIAKAARPVCALLIVSGVVAFSIYSPFSIPAWQSGTIGQQLTYTEVEMELDHMYSLVPLSASVLVQNDMPQLMNRAGVYLVDFYNNQTVEFAVMNPLAFNAISAIFGDFSLYWANEFASNQSYSIFAEVQGAVLFQRHYSGLPVYTIPLTESYQQNASFSDGQSVPYNQLYDSPVWLLSPGSYLVTFNLSGATCTEIPPELVYRVVSSPQSTVLLSNHTAPICNPSTGDAIVSFQYSVLGFSYIRFPLFLPTNESSTDFSVTSVSAQQTVS